MSSSESVSETQAAATHAAWWQAPWKTMADLAEAVDDLICSFDYMDTAMDNLVMLVFIWVLFSIVILGIAKWAYGRFSVKAVEDKTDKPKDDKKTANEIITSSDSVLATSAKIKSAAFKPSKPTSFVPATPPNKKRLGRMSPGPEQLSLKKHHSIIVPTCTGSDSASVHWVNEVLTWLYNDLVIVNDLVQQWIVSMNEFSKKSVEEQGVGVELVRALDSHPPSLSNVFCECDSKDDVTITCDCEATPAFQLKAFSQRGEKVEVSHYRVNVNKFRARLHIVCVTDKLTGELKCDGWPDVKVALAPVGPLRPNAAETDLQQLISDIVVGALRSTQLSFNLSRYPTCPRLRRYVADTTRLPLHYDSMLQGERPVYSSTPNSTAGCVQLLGDKRLLVKVVSAKDLGGKSGCIAPYCVVEMDEPPQKNQTAFKKDTVSPVWEEHFLFDLSAQTAELLFEVYDRGATPVHRFLGLGLVGIDELLAAPSQRQQIALQTRPMEEHDVSGNLTVEFLFIEGADIPDLGSKPYKIKESLRTVTPQGRLTTTTKTTFQQNGHDAPQLTQSALRELELSPTAAANKSTLIIHSVQREPTKSIKVEMTNSGKFIEVEREALENTENIDKTINKVVANNTDQPLTIEKNVTPNQSPAKSVRIKENGAKVNGDSEAVKQGDFVNQESPPEPVPRKRKRDFFGTIKRRLGRSRTRGHDLQDDDHVRSVSAERNNQGKALVPSRTVYSAGASPAQSGDESRTSRRSSLSEVSGFSTASARTFIHEASTLVLETIEAGIKKHYLVPLTVAQRSRWRRKGVKLHIYNEHTFIAKHLSGGTVCPVCNKAVARRLGKQGYECRDCLLRCHKHCHVRVPAACERSTVRDMELFRARLHIVCVTDKLTGELKCDGWPDVKVALAPVGPLRPNAAETDLQQLISDIVVGALRSTQLSFNLSRYPTCPRLRRYVADTTRLPLHYDSMLQGERPVYSSTPNSTAGCVQLLGDKRLLVKVVSAKDLGGKSGCIAPYCVVEMDEPPQKNQTAFKKDTVSPVWEEHFLFDLSAQTAELLFEVYDRGATPVHRFLGLGLVGIDELLAAPSQRQQIALQTRPMEEHDVSGNLTVEFLFIEGADIPDLGSKPYKIKESLRTVTPQGRLTTTTKTTFQQNGHDAPQLTQSALRELELSPTAAANKSTLIIHSVQREPTKSIKVEMTNSGKFIEVEREALENTENVDKTIDKVVANNTDQPLTIEKNVTPNQSPAKSVRIKENGAKVNGDSEAVKQGDFVNQESPPEPVPRKRKRDFFGTIKRRLGRSRTRGHDLQDDDHVRSVSAERNHQDKALVPSRTVYSAGASPAQSGDESRTSRRSSLSEVSGFSTASARTFIHEASTLVLETIEAGIKKHYLVPLTVAQRSRWRRKGVKLHIYNEHTFIAKHLSGGTVCPVCNKAVARRLGKQGYECRDCLLRCHKHCHVRVPAACERSTVRDMELAYISSPYTDRNIRML